jgi:hypothetical protein
MSVEVLDPIAMLSLSPQNNDKDLQRTNEPSSLEPTSSPHHSSSTHTSHPSPTQGRVRTPAECLRNGVNDLLDDIYCDRPRIPRSRYLPLIFPPINQDLQFLSSALTLSDQGSCT